MQSLDEILKIFGAVVALLIPFLKPSTGPLIGRHKKLEERHRRLRQFFDEGGTRRPALLVESSFGAALGHLKLTATEISILLRQSRPTVFIATYLRVRGHLIIDATGTKFVLRGVAACTWGRRTLVALGLVVYAFFFLAAGWVAFYLAPPYFKQGDWGNVAACLLLVAFLVYIAGYALVLSSRLYWAVVVCGWQDEPKPSRRIRRRNDQPNAALYNRHP